MRAQIRNPEACRTDARVDAVEPLAVRPSNQNARGNAARDCPARTSAVLYAHVRQDRTCAMAFAEAQFVAQQAEHASDGGFVG